MRKALSLAVLAALIAGVPRAGVAAAPTVDERMARAKALFEGKDFAGAAAELEAVYAESPSSRVLVGWAQAEKYAGNCDRSLELYARFLEQDPAPEDVHKVQPYIDECRAEVEASEAASAADGASSEATAGDEGVIAPLDPKPAPKLDPRPLEPASPVDDAPPRPWYRDPAGGALVGVGAAFTLAGVGLAVAASVENARIETIGQHGAFEDGLDRALLEARLSYGAFAVGGALLVAGAIRYGVLARRGKRDRTVALVPTGRAVVVHGRF